MELHKSKYHPASSVSIRMPLSDRPVSVVPGRASRGWWLDVERGKWEMMTLRALNQHIRSNTTYIGFGEWCGVTGLYAAQRAKTTVMIDADPIAFDEMKRNVGGNEFSSNIIFDNRCISNASGHVNMRVHGGSGSSIVMRVGWSGFKTITVDCVPLPRIVQEYKLTVDGSTFIKIDTEGAESLILPSLFDWILQTPAARRPTLFISMHATSNASQKAAIASLFNLYPYFATIKGRQPELTSQEMWVDQEACLEGVPLTRNEEFKHFKQGNICDWCDYLLTAHDSNICH